MLKMEEIIAPMRGRDYLSPVICYSSSSSITHPLNVTGHKMSRSHPHPWQPDMAHGKLGRGMLAEAVYAFSYRPESNGLAVVGVSIWGWAVTSGMEATRS